MSTPLPRARRPLAALLLPLAIAGLVSGGGAWWVLAHRSRLPERLVTHWGPGGVPNGWSSLPSAVTTGVVFPVAVALGLGLLAWATRLREVGALASGMAVFLGGIAFGPLWGQRDGRVAGTGPWLLGGLLAGVLVGLLAWVVLRDRSPRPVAEAHVPEGAPRVEVPRQARVAWVGHTRNRRAATTALVVLSLVPVVLFAVAGLLADPWFATFLLLVEAGLLVLLTSMWARVTVDARGVRAVGRVVAVRWVDIPLAEIEGASVREHVDPMGDFGGWGSRTALSGSSGEKGLVTSAGEALVVHRAGGPDHVITVDDAASAAAAVNALVERR